VKVRKIEIDTNSTRILRENGSILTGTIKEIYKVKVDSIYFSMFPGLGIGGAFKKRAIIKEYNQYSMVIRSKKQSGHCFVGMLKAVTYNNIKTFLKKHRIKAGHIYITPFTLYRFTAPDIERHLVVYKGDVMIHLLSFEKGFPVFATSFVSFSQLDEFIGEFYEDGNANLTFLSNRQIQYKPPVDFKDTEFMIEEGVLLNA